MDAEVVGKNVTCRLCGKVGIWPTFPRDWHFPFSPTTSGNIWTTCSQPEDEGRTFIRGVGQQTYHTAQKTRKRSWTKQNLKPRSTQLRISSWSLTVSVKSV